MRVSDWIAHNILRVPKPEVAMEMFADIMRQSPVAEALIRPEDSIIGTGPEWAKTVYGEYYLKSVPIYAAVKLRADNVVRAPLRVFKTDAKGDKTEVPSTHPLSQLLGKVNPWWTRGDLIRGTSTYLDLWGSAFWVLKKATPTSVPTEIWLARPDKMRIIASKTEYIAGFEFRDGSEVIPLLPEEVIWFRFFNPMAELAGLSPVAVDRLSADTAIDAMKSNRNLFRNGPLFSNIFLKADVKMSDQEVEAFSKRISKRYSGPDNANRPFIGSHIEPKNMGFSPKDMEHINTLRWSLEDVSRVYGVPKPLLGDLERATYANIQEAQNIFWRNTMVPYMMFFQEEINEMLVPMFKDPSLTVEFDLSDIEALQENLNEVSERLNAQVDKGILTINEVRAKMGMEPVGWGDVWWAPATLLPVTDSTAPQQEPVEEMGLLPVPRMRDFSGNGHRRYTPPALTDENLQKLSDMFVKRLDLHERRFAELLRKLFARQLRDILSRLRATKAIERQVGETLFSPDEWLEQWVNQGRPLMAQAVIDSAQEQIGTFGLGIAFDVNSPITQEWLDRRTEFWANRVNDETGRLITQEIRAAAELGESIPEIQVRVEKVFRLNDAIRTERIARTEMLNATNQGSLEAYKQSGIVEQKMWLATLDDRTREDHVEAHRQRVPLESDFEVGGEMLPHPGAGSAAQAINCRCTVAPVISSGTRRVSPGVKKEDSG